MLSRTVKEALHDQIHSSATPIKVQADELGISYSYLANAANPTLDDFQFQLRHLLPLCRITGRTDVLDHIENALGRIAFDLPKPNPCSLSLQRDLADCFKEFGEFAEVSAKAIADNRIDKTEFRQIEQQLLDLVRTAMRFLRTVQEASR